MKMKYIVILANEINFITHKFNEERMSKLSKIQWIPLTPAVRTE